MVRPQFSLRTLLVLSISLGVACGTYSWWWPRLQIAWQMLTPVEERPIAWQEYSPELLADAKESGKPVLLFFDADWDLATKVNLHFEVEQPEVRRLISDHDITPIKADMTNGDDEVANEARKYVEYGATPLMVIHDSRSWKQPVVLTGVQTRARVAAALRRAGRFQSHRPAKNICLAPLVGAIGMLLGVAFAHLLAKTETPHGADGSASTVAGTDSASASGSDSASASSASN